MADELGRRCAAEGEPDTDACNAIQGSVVDQLRLQCLYEALGEACDDLQVRYGLTSDDNYGLGDGLTQAPDEFLVEDCDGGYRLACAEAMARGLLGE